MEETQPQPSIFTPSLPPASTPLLLQSLWRPLNFPTASPVFLHETYIFYNNQYLPFHFDLKFSTSENTISFTINQHTNTFEFVNDDQEAWRNALKSKLNQTGFHTQFKSIKKIGKGNFASVYLVERLLDGEQFAVKAFSKEAAFSEQHGKECLIKQIEIMRKLNNPHNLKLVEVYESDNSLYIVFELLSGGQLFEKIKAKQKFIPAHIQTIIRNILEGLQEMHSKNIMHRDLKPENILLRSQNAYDCVIADYGLAEFSNEQEYLFVRCGTPGYVAPEVINIKDMKTKYDPICDIFSLGLIFHLLLFGKSVFKGKTYNEVLNENRNCNFKLEGQEYSHFDQHSIDLLTKMLKVNPKERISAQQALLHPYFSQDQPQKQTKVDEEELAQLVDKVNIGESPILTTANQKRKQQKDLKRDSCLDFKMAKDTVMTGKIQTAGTMESGKISGFGANLLKGFKPSKFVKPTEAKQN